MVAPQSAGRTASTARQSLRRLIMKPGTSADSGLVVSIGGVDKLQVHASSRLAARAFLVALSHAAQATHLCCRLIPVVLCSRSSLAR